MEYWRGDMNWEVVDGWVCETCGKDSTWLIWGLRHAECRCTNCHTQYMMRDEDTKIVNVPISQLKEEYKISARIGYEMYHKPFSEWSDDEWDKAFEQAPIKA